MKQTNDKTKFVIHDGGRYAAGYTGIAGDCVCRAISIAAALPYAEVYERLAVGNQKQRVTKRTRPHKARVKTASHGISTSRKWFKDYMKELGFHWVSCMSIGSGCKVHLTAEELPAGRLVVMVSKHAVAMIDGVIYDTYNPDRGGKRCVYGYYILQKKERKGFELTDEEKHRRATFKTSYAFYDGVAYYSYKQLCGVRTLSEALIVRGNHTELQLRRMFHIPNQYKMVEIQQKKIYYNPKFITNE